MDPHALLLEPVEEIKIEIDLSNQIYVPKSKTNDYSVEQASHPNSQWIEKISTEKKSNEMITIHIRHDEETEHFQLDPIFQSASDPLVFVNSWDINKEFNENVINDKKPPKKRKLPRGTYVCDYCSKKFIMRTSIVRHMKLHTGLGVYRCEICGDIFPTYCKLETHNMIVHTGERPFVCQVCNAGFTQKYTMDDHKLIHSGERPFECTVCTKTFVRQRNLNAHMKLHNSKREHQCDICMRKFSVKSNMTKHKLRHDNLVPRPFFCGLCGKTYEQRGHLEDHLRKHTGEKPFSCDLCDKKFARFSSLTLHTKQHHTEAISIECQFCDKMFNHERALKMHMMTHRDEKPYICNVCKKGFVRRGDRNRHVLTHQSQYNSKFVDSIKTSVSD